jgi:phage replication O-like protein O
MSTAQFEGGFVRIANELLEAMLRGGFSQRELLVLLTIMRKTDGFRKAEDDISASQIGAICNLARTHVTATLNQLALHNVITKRPGRFGSIVGIQRDYRKWKASGQTPQAQASTESVQGSTDSVHVPDQYASSTASVQVDSTDAVHTKDNLPRDNHQKKRSCAPQADRDQVAETPAGQKGRAKTGLAADLQDRFERFYAAYPLKKSRGTAEKAFAKIRPDEELLGQMLGGLEKRRASGTWLDPKFVPYPATWLKAQGWLDALEVEYSVEACAVIDAFNELLGPQLGEVSAAIFVPARAALIGDFLRFSTKGDLARRYFTWLRDDNDLPPKIGFDRLVGRQGYADAIGGKFARKA